MCRARRTTGHGWPSFGEYVVEHHAGDLGRVLHHEMQPGNGTLPRRKGEDVDTIERDASRCHRVAGLAHHDAGQRALAGAVRAHHCVDLARADDEVDPLEDLAVADGGVEVPDLEGAHELTPSLVSAFWSASSRSSTTIDPSTTDAR